MWHVHIRKMQNLQITFAYLYLETANVYVGIDSPAPPDRVCWASVGCPAQRRWRAHFPTLEFWATTRRGRQLNAAVFDRRPLAVEVWIFNSYSQRRRRAHSPTLEFWATTRRERPLAVEVWIFNSDFYGAIYT